ncbi:hypothetical protein GYMLUDRAFT_764818 [Collybiopsis luxurians FD-317 M1]|uniref:Ketoreductase domain-containing protein n=1 Tax=Collybiopsis luxurians FD-317 M1 TaxID=944289 RepID=A0A0D0B206_9AGAR|nr:hypothetical protein GYMLUDRAFT_764818 [Collybiopsis luxurians FD-317 M1]
MTSQLSSPFRNLPVTAHHDIYDAISPELYFSSTSTAFRNKIVLVIGASKGIGLSIATFYARAGAKLAIVSRSQDTLDEAKARIVSDISGTEVLAVAADVVDTKAIEGVVGKVIEKYGKLDIVIANSGITGPWTKSFPENDPINDWWKVLEVNLRGVYNVAHYVFPHLVKTNGFFIAMSSMVPQRGLPFASAYAASKVALNRFIEYAAVEHPTVKSLAFHPGTIQTEGSLASGQEALKQYMIDTIQLPAAAILKLTDGSGRFDWLSGRFISANWDLEEIERDHKDEIIKNGLLLTRFIA